MGKKFDTIYESVVSRGESGSYLPGDIVIFRPNYKSSECYKNMPTIAQKEVDELAKCGLNIRVAQVGNNLSGHSAGNQFKSSLTNVLTIAADHGGGRTYGRIVVTPDMVDLADLDNHNLAPIPDQFRRKDKVTIKPQKYDRDKNFITNVTDKGNGKNTPTELKLAGESRSWDDAKNLVNLYENAMWSRGFENAVQNFQKGSGQEVDILRVLSPKMEEGKNKGLDFNQWLQHIEQNYDIRVQNMDFDIIELLKRTYENLNK